jgi:hypothetical protein
MTLDPQSLESNDDRDLENGPPYPLFGVIVPTSATAGQGAVGQGEGEASSAEDGAQFAA